MQSFGEYYMDRQHEMQQEGFGTVSLGNGTVYEGEFLRSVYHGYGQLKLANGNYYKGKFQNGQYEGIGELFDTKTQIRIKGEFSGG